MPVGRVGIGALHVDVVQDAPRHEIDVADLLQPRRQEAQQHLALAMRLGRGEQPVRHQHESERGGEPLVEGPELLDVERQLRLRPVEQAEAQQPLPVETDLLAHAVDAEGAQHVVGIGEGTGGEDRRDPALPRHDLRKALRRDGGSGIDKQRRQRRGEARQHVGIVIACAGRHLAEIDAAQLAVVHLEDAEQLVEFRDRRIALARIGQDLEALQGEGFGHKVRLKAMEMRSAAAAIRSHLMQQPGGEHNHASSLGPEPLRAARRLAARHGVGKLGRHHHRHRPARVHEFELAAQRRVGVDAAIVDIVDCRPHRLGMRVVLVAVAAAIDVGPDVGDPGHADEARMRSAADDAAAIHGDTVGDVAAEAPAA